MMEYVDFVEPDFSDDVAELETGKQSAAAPAEAQKMIKEKESTGNENAGHENSGNENSSNENAEQRAEQPEKIIEIDFPMVTSLANRIRMNDRNVIVNIINEQLMEGAMSTILHKPVLTEEISGDDISLGNITFWRLSRTELLADVEVSVRFTIADKNNDYVSSVGMYVTLWYDSDEGFFGELYEMGGIENRPDRSYWKLDPFMVPFLSKDSVEQAGEEQWQEKHSEAMKDAGERKAQILADAYGLQVVSMRLAGCPAQDHVLFFDAGTVLVQDPPARGVRQLPPPRPVEVGEKTIVINSAAKARTERDLIIYKACLEYEWYYLFYKLNGCVNTDARQFRYYKRKLKVKKEGSVGNPLTFIRTMTRKGGMALMMPLTIMEKKWWREYQIAGTSDRHLSYWNHDGWRNEQAIRVISDEFDIRKYLVRQRLIQMGRIAAKGALNYDQERQKYNPAFAFEKSTLGKDREYAISRAELFRLYQSDSKFREQAREGLWAFLDGLVCLNNSEFICRKGDSHQLTPSANRRVNQCCLRFIRTFEEDSPRSRVDWSAFKEQEMYSFIRNCERIREANEQTKADILARVPDTFTGALEYMMRLGMTGKMNDAMLGVASTLGADVIRDYRTNPNRIYDLVDLVMICVALKLPPWLSEVLLERANLHVKRTGKQSVYGFILDCLYLDEGKTVRSFLSPAENRPVIAEEEEAPYSIPA